MALLKGINVATQSLGVEWTTLIVIVLLAGMPIFFARDHRIGLMISLILSTGVFIWFYQGGYDWTKPLAIAIISIILLALSLIASLKTREASVV